MGTEKWDNLHMETMTIIWILLSDLLTISVTFSSSKLGIYIHGIGFTLISAFTIFVTYHIFLGAYDHLDPVSDTKFYVHVFFGCICMLAMITQIILGILTRVTNMMGGRSVHILNIKRFHMISGITLLIITKLQVYYMINDKKRIFCLIIDLLFVICYYFRTLGRKKLTYEPIEAKRDEVVTVRSLESLKKVYNKLYIYGNYVYDLSNVTQWHPAGFQILEYVKNAQIQRFLFGIYSSFQETAIRSYAHSKESLKLLDDPIAKIDIPTNFNGLNAQNVASLIELRLFSEGSNVYELHLRPKNNGFAFLKYTDIKQIGRCYFLTLDNRITRIYTCVNFLNWNNAIFLKQYLKPTKQLEKYYLERHCHTQSIPILFKHYSNGRFTNSFVENRSQQLKISDQQGLGLQLDENKQGEIIIMAGGTGIFPFLDLLDLIYKHHLINLNSNISKSIIEDNPLVASDLFKKHAFTVYAAFQSISQIHPIILQQWIELSSSSIISIVLNIKNKNEKTSYPELKFTEERFEKLAQKCLERKELSKIYVCGPPRMNEALSRALSQITSEEKYKIL